MACHDLLIRVAKCHLVSELPGFNRGLVSEILRVNESCLCHPCLVDVPRRGVDPWTPRSTPRGACLRRRAGLGGSPMLDAPAGTFNCVEDR
jgi:hypothetical protein